MGAWAPMAEQKAVAGYLVQTDAVNNFLARHKRELNDRLVAIYNGITALKEKGLPVDSIAPQAAMYLTIKLPLVGMHADGHALHDQKEVTEYILSKAKLAVVPFYAFGAGKNSPWYRMSVGTCHKEEIPEVLGLLENALAELV